MTKKKTLIVTIFTAIVWSLAVLFGYFDIDIPFAIMLWLITPTSLVWVSWIVKILFDKIGGKDVRYTTILIPLTMVFLIPCIALAVQDIFFSTGFLAGLVGYVLAIFMIAPAGALLLAAFIVRIRWRVRKWKSQS